MPVWNLEWIFTSCLLTNFLDNSPASPLKKGFDPLPVNRYDIVHDRGLATRGLISMPSAGPPLILAGKGRDKHVFKLDDFGLLSHILVCCLSFVIMHIDGLDQSKHSIRCR